MKHNYTKEFLQENIKDCTSMRQFLIKLNLAPKGGNFGIMKARLIKNSIDYSHFTGAGWRKGKKFSTPIKKIEEIFINGSTYRSGSPYQSNKLKTLLFKNDLKCKKCENCNLITWLGFDLAFELHHIDGNTFNNELNNLQILCPNCHSLTDNFRGKNIK